MRMKQLFFIQTLTFGISFVAYATTTSIIIPCHYKHAHHLYALLQHYHQQTVRPDEVVIALSEFKKVDQDTLDTLRDPSLERQLGFNLVLFFSFEAKTAGENRNIACKQATGDILILQDADDIPHPQRVEIIKYCFEQYGITHLMHQFVAVDRNRKQIPFRHYKEFNLIETARPQPEHCANAGTLRGFTHGSIALTKKIFDAIQWSALPVSQDQEFNTRVYRTFTDTLLLKAPLIAYRHFLSSHTPSENNEPFVYHGHDETVHKITAIINAQQKGAYLRIGDGDTALANGLSSGTHQGNEPLRLEEQEVLRMEGPTIIKTLPLDPHVHQKTNDYYDAHLKPERIQLIINEAMPWWSSDRHVYSPYFLTHYAITDLPRCIDFLVFLKKANCPLLVGNEQIPNDLRSLFFGPQCAFVSAPARNAYTAIDRIERETIQALKQLDPQKYHVIILSCGNTGRVLTKRLYDKVGDNFFFFDFGSLMDAACGFKTRIWIRTYFNYDLFMAELKKSLKDV